MKSINVILYWVIVMVIGLSACGDDDEKTIPAHTEEEKIWIADNQKYFQEKKEDVEDDGQLLYQRLVVDEDTLLYRVLETSQIDSFPKIDADVKVPNLIKGLAALLPKIRKGERVDAIIPYQLGYGDRNYSNPYIPLCSTLQFTFTVKSFD